MLPCWNFVPSGLGVQSFCNGSGIGLTKKKALYTMPVGQIGTVAFGKPGIFDPESRAMFPPEIVCLYNHGGHTSARR